MTTRPITEDEHRRLLAAVGGRMVLRDRCLIELMYRTGARISEALSLRLGNVLERVRADGTEQWRIVARLQIAKRHTKGKRKGYGVVLHAAARAALEAWLREAAGLGWSTAECYLFMRLGRGNRPITRSHAWRIIDGAASAAGLDGCVGNHSLRKSYGMGVYERSGRDIRVTQEALRHVSLDSTLRYLPVSQDRIDRLTLGHDERGDGGA
jgi:integrase/recombinase XerD